MAGIDKSDFQPLGRPQLSSTIGPRLDGAASQTREEYQDVWAKTDALSVVRVCKCLQCNYACMLYMLQFYVCMH